MPTARLLSLSLLLLGCGGSRVVREEPAPVATTGTTGVVVVELSAGGTAEPPPPPAPRSDIPMQVQWSHITSSGGCFFFSGPEALGRDDHLGALASYFDGGQTARLVFDSRIVFEGYTATVPYTLVRTSVHQYSGTWSVRETFALEALQGRAFRGTYHYDELGPSGEPTGSCQIDAAVTLTPY